MKLTRTTSPFKKLFKGIPDPKIKLRVGSGKVFNELVFTPLTELQIEIPTLMETFHMIKHKKSDLQKLKTHKFKTYYLFAKRKR